MIFPIFIAHQLLKRKLRTFLLLWFQLKMLMKTDFLLSKTSTLLVKNCFLHPYCFWKLLSLKLPYNPCSVGTLIQYRTLGEFFKTEIQKQLGTDIFHRIA